MQLSTRTVVLVSQPSTTLLPAACCGASSQAPHTLTLTCMCGSQVLAWSDSLSHLLACLYSHRPSIPSALLPWRLRPKPRQVPKPPRYGPSRLRPQPSPTGCQPPVPTATSPTVHTRTITAVLPATSTIGDVLSCWTRRRTDQFHPPGLRTDPPGEDEV